LGSCSTAVKGLLCLELQDLPDPLPSIARDIIATIRDSFNLGEFAWAIAAYRIIVMGVQP